MEISRGEGSLVLGSTVASSVFGTSLSPASESGRTCSVTVPELGIRFVVSETFWIGSAVLASSLGSLSKPTPESMRVSNGEPSLRTFRSSFANANSSSASLRLIS